MRGWATPLKDKTLKNDLVDTEAINVPNYIQTYKEPGIDPMTAHQMVASPCKSFVYSSFISPGHH